MARMDYFFRQHRTSQRESRARDDCAARIWAAFLVLLRTRWDSSTARDVRKSLRVLLDYVIFAALMFYVLTIGGVLVLRVSVHAERPTARGVSCRSGLTD